MKLKIGMGQLLVEGGEPERNLERARIQVEQAAAAGCQLALLPECLDLGWTHPSALTEAQPIPGPRSELLAGWAREHGIFICAGLTERAGDRVYNSAILLDTAGEQLLHYRKINVLEVGKPFYAIGDRLGVVDTPFGRIGLNICSDNYLDAIDIGHTLARMGAQLILSPSSWTVDYSVDDRSDPYGDKWVRPLRTLAALHDLVILSVTSVGYVVGGPYEGKKMVGCSLAVGPDGILLEGRYNEVAGEVRYVEFEVPDPLPLGTAVGERMRERGRRD